MPSVVVLVNPSHVFRFSAPIPSTAHLAFITSLLWYFTMWNPLPSRHVQVPESDNNFHFVLFFLLFFGIDRKNM